MSCEECDDRHLLFYNPAWYVVDVIGEGRAATVGVQTMATSTTPHWPGVGRPNGLGQDVTSPDAAQNAAAVTMNNALLAHGYKQSDMGIYKAFQSAVGLTPDGFPGTKTMQELKDVLFALGIEMADVPVYPWLGPPHGYDGVNAPLLSDWAPGSTPSTPTPTTPTPSGTTTVPTTTVTATPAKSNAGIIIAGTAAAALAGTLGYIYYRRHRSRR